MEQKKNLSENFEKKNKEKQIQLAQHEKSERAWKNIKWMFDGK